MGYRPHFYVLWPRFKNAASEPFFHSERDMCKQHLNSKIMSRYLLWTSYMDPNLKSFEKNVGLYFL